MNDEDRLRALRAFDMDDIPSLTHEGGENIMETIEQRPKEIGNELRSKVEPVARRAYSATKAVIAAPDEEPGARPNKAVLARMLAFFAAEDDEPKAE